MSVPFVAQLPGAHAPAPPIAIRRVPTEFGSLAMAMSDAEVTDVFVVGDGTVWMDRGDGVRPAEVPRLSVNRARELAVRLISSGSRHADEVSPCVDVRLEGGIRVHVVLPPISTGGALISIRIPSPTAPDLDELDRRGFFDRVARTEVDALVARRANLLITGAGGAGKTTFLGAVLGSAPPHERIVIIEDVAELRVTHPHVVSLQARQPNLEGAGGVGLDRLVRESLRMRPDRLVVGECRGIEVRELLSALNTGHDGGAGTLHANSLDDVPARLEALGALAGLTPDALGRQAVSAFDAVLHLVRDRTGRRLASLGRLCLDPGGRLGIDDLSAP